MNKKNNAIYTSIYGGLGNQLFQYSAARRLSLINDLPIIFETSYFENDRIFNSKFLLEQFNIIEHEIISDQNLFKSIRGKDLWKIPSQRSLLSEPRFIYGRRKYRKVMSAGGARHKLNRKVIQGHFDRSIYLDGYWQSEEYFKDIRDILLAELRPKLPLTTEKQQQLNDIKQINAVCIGVRRYQEAPEASVHYKLAADYYQRAIEIIKERVNNPKFLVFTLDHEWVSENLSGENIHIIPPADKKEEAFMDMILMSTCKHFIIANSTFHWWGAWLSQNQNKIVIAPQKGWRIRETIPENWISL